MKIKSGYSFYGQSIGVLVFQNTAPRIPGDAGHALSFSYPVCFEIIGGSFASMLKRDDKIKQSIIDACLRLKEKGIKGIVCDCGMMSLYQDVIGTQVKIPYIGSSLCQIPMIWQMIGRSGSIGVLTGHSELLSDEHLKASGCTDEIQLSIQGMQNETHFEEIVIDGGHDLNTERMKQDVLNAVRKLMNRTKDLRAIVLECSNLSTYSHYISQEFDIPVFDTMSAANMLAYALTPPDYNQI